MEAPIDIRKDAVVILFETSGDAAVRTVHLNAQRPANP